MTKEIIGQKIQELRKKRGLTQDELAQKTNLSLRTIQRIEAGEVDPRLYTVKIIAVALGVTLEEIMPENKRDNKLWIVGLHLTNIFCLVFPAVLIWLYKKNDIPQMDEQGKAVINFQITMMICLFASSFLVLILIGILLLWFLGIFIFVVTMINIVRVANDSPVRYPLSHAFLK